jgi:ABC-type bacteriocin/lantibiotic exporter with double-glycine peptidase domain
MTKDVWIKARGALGGELLDPLVLLEDGRIWRALALHHRFVLRYALAVNDEFAVAEAARLKEKAARSTDLTRAALARLMAVGGEAPAAELLTPTHDALLTACELIGRRLDVAFRAPLPFERQALDRDPVGTLAAASNLRFRQVALKDEWWTADVGPLLATVGDGKEWVALLPARDGHYEMHNPATGRVERVTPAVAQNLGAFAYVFYRPFPSKPLALLDILRFGVHGLYRDIAMVVALGALLGILGMVLPIASGKLIDTIIPSADRAGIWQMTAALIAASVAASLFELARAVALLRVEGKMDAGVQAAVWDRVLKLPVPFFRNYTAGDLALRINGVNTIRHALSGIALATLLGGVFSVFNLALLFYYSASLAGIAMLLVLIALAVVAGVGYLKLRY